MCCAPATASKPNSLLVPVFRCLASTTLVQPRSRVRAGAGRAMPPAADSARLPTSLASRVDRGQPNWARCPRGRVRTRKVHPKTEATLESQGLAASRLPAVWCHPGPGYPCRLARPTPVDGKTSSIPALSQIPWFHLRLEAQLDVLESSRLLELLRNSPRPAMAGWGVAALQLGPSLVSLKVIA